MLKHLQQDLAWMHRLSALQAAADKRIGLSFKDLVKLHKKKPVVMLHAALPENAH